MITRYWNGNMILDMAITTRWCRILLVRNGWRTRPLFCGKTLCTCCSPREVLMLHIPWQRQHIRHQRSTKGAAITAYVCFRWAAVPRTASLVALIVIQAKQTYDSALEWPVASCAKATAPGIYFLYIYAAFIIVSSIFTRNALDTRSIVFWAVSIINEALKFKMLTTTEAFSSPKQELPNCTESRVPSTPFTSFTYAGVAKLSIRLRWNPYWPLSRILRENQKNCPAV